MVFLGNKILFLYNDAGGNMPKVNSAEELVELYKEGKRDFANSNLEGAYLYKANLEGANLEGARVPVEYENIITRYIGKPIWVDDKWIQ